MKKIKMYLIVFFITFVHLLITMLWLIEGSVDTSLSYTKNLLEYSKCSYPLSKNISVILNYSILIFGCILTYFTKNVTKKFTEKMTIPTYAYIVITTVLEVLNMENEISVVIQDLFNGFGTIIIIIITIIYIYVIRLYSIFYKIPTKLSKFSSSEIFKSHSHNEINPKENKFYLNQ
ncbi:hypothetical protein BCR36DRAFT_328050, partial [Piromyces finnis]